MAARSRAAILFGAPSMGLSLPVAGPRTNQSVWEISYHCSSPAYLPPFAE